MGGIVLADTAAQIGRIEKRPLRFGANPMHGARADHVAGRERVRDGMQERVAQVDRQRPSFGQHGVETSR